MKKIKLTRGEYAIVDDEDFEFLNRWKWYFKPATHGEGGYARRDKPIKLIKEGDKGKGIWMHRVINKTPEGLFTDHINGDKLDNRKCNLRNATKISNGINRGKQANNTSGVKGVHWNRGAQKWVAEICINQKRYYLGLFSCLKEAGKARLKAEKIYHEI